MLVRRLANVAARSIKQGKGFTVSPIARKEKDDREMSEEEKYAAKHDYELLLKFAQQQNKKQEQQVEQVKKDVQKQIDQSTKKNTSEIDALKEEVQNLKNMLNEALKKK
ncbi:hypothetical protein ABK040_003322 [Willaertia magna]